MGKQMKIWAVLVGMVMAFTGSVSAEVLSLDAAINEALEKNFGIKIASENIKIQAKAWFCSALPKVS